MTSPSSGNLQYEHSTGVVKSNNDKCTRFHMCFFFLQGNQGMSLSNSGTHTWSGSSQASLSTNSYDLMDKAGKEHIYTTIGLYQVLVLFRVYSEPV